MPGADGEREGKKGHQDERRKHAARARPPLTGRIEALLPEDEGGDQRQEGKPVLLRLPEETPERLRVTDVELANGERSVETQGEPAQVEHEQSGDARKAPSERDQRPALKEERAGGADVPATETLVLGGRGRCIAPSGRRAVRWG